MNIGQEVRKTRKHRGMSQKDLASDVGCSVSQLRNIEAGRGHPSVQVLDRIASVTDTLLIVTFVER